MFAVEQPDADCGHDALLRQQCGRCLQWCCTACYSPWMALACNACRAEAALRAPAWAPVLQPPVDETRRVEAPDVEIVRSRRCRDRVRGLESANCRHGDAAPRGPQ